MSASNESKFNKIIDKYNTCFQTNISSFRSFLDSRVVLTQASQQKLSDYIQDNFEDEFSQESLRTLLHLVAAEQAGRNIDDLHEN